MPGRDGWRSALSLLRALHHPVEVVSRLSEKNNLAAVALTDVQLSRVKRLLRSSGAAWLLHCVSLGVTTREERISAAAP